MRLASCRRGYTLIELGVCLAVLAIMATVALPALMDFGRAKPRRTAEELVSLLEDSRKIAIDSNVNVSVVVDPASGEYLVDSIGINGSGVVWSGILDMLAMEMLATEAPRLRYYFRPTGSAIGDTVRVQGASESVVLYVDPWNGIAHAGN